MGCVAETLGVAGVRPDGQVRRARLADDRSVVIRNAAATDLAGIVDFFERLSAASRYGRLFAPQPRLRRAMVEHAVAPGDGHVAVLAQPLEFRATARHVVAVGGWVYVPREDRCQVSVAVADAWQGVTLGTSIVLVLLQAAIAGGHRRFSAEVLNARVRMLGFLRDLGLPVRTSHEAGVVRVEFELPLARP